MKKLISKFVRWWFYKYHYQETYQYFLEQSQSYPFWWRNFEWWGNTSSSKSWNEQNPIYKHKYNK